MWKVHSKHKANPFFIVRTTTQLVSRLHCAQHLSKMCDTKREKGSPISVSWLTHQWWEHLAGERKLSVRPPVSLCSTTGASDLFYYFLKQCDHAYCLICTDTHTHTKAVTLNSKCVCENKCVCGGKRWEIMKVPLFKLRATLCPKRYV